MLIHDDTPLTQLEQPKPKFNWGREDELGNTSRLLLAKGITSKDEVTACCGDAGTLSGPDFYALRLAGFNGVRLHANSFLEWKQLDIPVKVVDADYWDLSAH